MAEGRRDYRGLAGGIVLGIVGAMFALEARSYEMGTPFQMGPGYLPLVLGVILIVCGGVIALLAWQTPGGTIVMSWRPLAAILASVTVFGLMIDRFGMVPAIIATVLVAALGDRMAKLVPSMVLSVAVAAGAVAIFHYGIGMTVPVARWPL